MSKFPTKLKMFLLNLAANWSLEYLQTTSALMINGSSQQRRIFCTWESFQGPLKTNKKWLWPTWYHQTPKNTHKLYCLFLHLIYPPPYSSQMTSKIKISDLQKNCVVWLIKWLLFSSLYQSFRACHGQPQPLKTFCDVSNYGATEQ